MERCLEDTIAKSEAYHQKIEDASSEGATSTQRTMQETAPDGASLHKHIWPRLFSRMGFDVTGETPNSEGGQASETGGRNWWE
jgi:hypothetical protein